MLSTCTRHNTAVHILTEAKKGQLAIARSHLQHGSSDNSIPSIHGIRGTHFNLFERAITTFQTASYLVYSFPTLSGLFCFVASSLLFLTPQKVASAPCHPMHLALYSVTLILFTLVQLSSPTNRTFFQICWTSRCRQSHRAARFSPWVACPTLRRT